MTFTYVLASPFLGINSTKSISSLCELEMGKTYDITVRVGRIYESSFNYVIEIGAEGCTSEINTNLSQLQQMSLKTGEYIQLKEVQYTGFGFTLTDVNKQIKQDTAQLFASTDMPSKKIILNFNRDSLQRLEADKYYMADSEGHDFLFTKALRNQVRNTYGVVPYEIQFIGNGTVLSIHYLGQE